MILARPPSRRALVALVAALLVCAVAPLSSSRGQEDEEKKPRDVTHFNLDKDKLALQGRDPVAYFPAGGGKPKKGKETITALHDGVLYRFANEKNKELFLADPAQFEPQYGGWCAYAMADAEKVEINPDSFLITDGKLYLFFKTWYSDTRSKWKKDEERLRTKADEAWKKLIEPPKPK